MAVRITVDVKARTVHSTFSGTVTIVDFLSGRDAVSKHPDFVPRFAHVLDFGAVSAVDIEPATVQSVVSMPSIFERDALQVVIATTESPVFEIAQTFKALAAGTGRDLRIAETLEEARAMVIAFG